MTAPNPVLRQLEETAAALRLPAATVAANWRRAGLLGPWSARKNPGVTREQYAAALAEIDRMAPTSATPA